MSINRVFNSTPGAFKNEPGPGKVSDNKIYVGIVMNNVDQQRMGRLEVFIPDIGGDINSPASWFIVSYASPFAGVSDPANMVAGGHNFGDAQQSYGWWAVPPDVGNSVLLTFINGDHSRGFWFACIYAQNMNHMVPGVAIDTSFENNSDKSLPPVTEYNRKDQSINTSNPVRPRFDPLALGLVQQGLTMDFERGSTSASARRDTPAKVYGYLTPRANQVYVDDNPDNEFIRLRTRSGTQVLVHETNGYVYINSGLGNSWIEVSDAGVDIYSRGSISVHTEQDFNVRADKNINLDAGSNIVMTAGSLINLYSGSDTTSLAGGNIRFNATNGEFTVLSSGNANVTTQGQMTLKSGGVHNRSAPQILDNTSTPADAPTVSKPPMTPQNNGSGAVNSPVSRMPNHEPWSGHPKSKDASPPSGVSANSFTPDGITNQSGPFKSKPAEGTSDQPQPVNATTGDGKTIGVVSDPNAGGTVKINNRNVRADVQAAIQKAASVTGISYGILMTICSIESSFNPNAKATTSSAYGLYQFIDSTWAAMVKKYGKKNNITLDMRSDVEAQALMGAFFQAENKAYLKSNLGTDPTDTDLYLAHFLGPAGAKSFLRAAPTSLAANAVTPASARANHTIFTATATIQDVYNHFQNKINPQVNAWQATQTA